MALDTNDIIKLGLVAAGGYVSGLSEVAKYLNMIPGGKIGKGLAPLLGALVIKYASDSEWADYIAYFLAGLSAGEFGDPDVVQQVPVTQQPMMNMPFTPVIIK